MKELLGFAHVSALEDIFYLLWDETVTVKSYAPHYTKVYVVTESIGHKDEMKDLIAPFLFLTKEEVDADIKESK